MWILRFAQNDKGRRSRFQRERELRSGGRCDLFQVEAEIFDNGV